MLAALVAVAVAAEVLLSRPEPVASARLPVSSGVSGRLVGLGSLRPPALPGSGVLGRDAELTRLRSALWSPAGSFAVLAGEGGFGKTMVAAALAADADRLGCTSSSPSR